jgi:hypothetical protein
MKNELYLRILIVGLTLLGLSGCLSQEAFPQTPVSTETTSKISPTLLVQDNKITSSPTQLYDTPTYTTTYTPTSTPFVPLSPEQQQQRHDAIVALLETNGGCKLPCWWGVTPGITAWDEAYQILSDEGIFFYRRENSTYGEFIDNLFMSNGIVQTEFHISSNNGIVKLIRIRSVFESSTSNNSPEFKTMWTNLTPEKLIDYLGRPTQVELRTTNNPGEGPISSIGQVLYLFYEDQGALFEYYSVNNLQSANTICPTFEEGGSLVNLIVVILKSPNDGSPLGNYDEAYNHNMNLSIEDAAGISLEEFYDLFHQSGKPKCFNLLPGVLK